MRKIVRLENDMLKNKVKSCQNDSAIFKDFFKKTRLLI